MSRRQTGRAFSSSSKWLRDTKDKRFASMCLWVILVTIHAIFQRLLRLGTKNNLTPFELTHTHAQLQAPHLPKLVLREFKHRRFAEEWIGSSRVR